MTLELQTTQLTPQQARVLGCLMENILLLLKAFIYTKAYSFEDDGSELRNATEQG